LNAQESQDDGMDGLPEPSSLAEATELQRAYARMTAGKAEMDMGEDDEEMDSDDDDDDEDIDEDFGPDDLPYDDGDVDAELPTFEQHDDSGGEEDGQGAAQFFRAIAADNDNVVDSLNDRVASSSMVDASTSFRKRSMAEAARMSQAAEMGVGVS